MPSMSDYKTVKVPTHKLNTGAEIPLVGFGTWKASPGEVKASVTTALQAGYRHIDCASAYGNQSEVGEAFQEYFSAGGKREDLWVTSKCFNSDHAAADVEKACKKTLSELKLEYLDLYLVHWPVTDKVGVPELTPPMTETWGAMEKLHQQGLAKAIGISNFSVKKTQDLLSYAKVKPAVQQVEIHPYWRNDKLVDFCKSQKIHLTAYSPLATPDSQSMMKRSDRVPVLLKDSIVNKIADKLGKTAGQVVLRWGLQTGHSVIPKSVNADRIKSNLEIVNFELSAEDFKTVNSLDFQARMLDGASVAQINPKGPYKTLDELWDGELSDFNREEYAKAAAKES